jgi:hypothetical protein
LQFDEIIFQTHEAGNKIVENHQIAAAAAIQGNDIEARWEVQTSHAGIEGYEEMDAAASGV